MAATGHVLRQYQAIRNSTDRKIDIVAKLWYYNFRVSHVHGERDVYKGHKDKWK